MHYIYILIIYIYVLQLYIYNNMLNVIYIYIYDMTYVVILLIFGCQSSSTKDGMGEHLHHQLAPHVPGGHEADDGDE